ncbi:ABC1 kinase family protein [Hoeflea sp.]|uniref:ABC1 kinase family protein n=1 Tax=Hoeflea sp. TaxID=1940281 RepID=UPI0037498633
MSRLALFGGMASGVLGGMLVDGARQVARGRRPSVSDLLLTPRNALRVTQQLAHLRGAAMKVGQLISMDTGEVLPSELTEVLSRLREDAQPMPAAQLNATLKQQWGADWRSRFAQFSATPMAAASIGQVHRAKTLDGRELAIKIQYPGVRKSIDSDVDNVGTLLRLSGLLPKGLDIAPLLAAAKQQLHEEADYGREGECLMTFRQLLEGSPEFLVPDLAADFSTGHVLAMTYVKGVPIEALASHPQELRDRVATTLIELVLREMFEFQLMQSDPNFANYRYDLASSQMVLLDFGATRHLSANVVRQYRELLKAGLAGNSDEVRTAALALGLFGEHMPHHHERKLLEMAELVFCALRTNPVFDFSDNTLLSTLRDQGMMMAAEREFGHVPPIDVLFLQRKIGGMYLLASRLKARVDIAGILEQYLQSPAPVDCD